MTMREFRLPDLGEGLTESDIVSWHVHAGDHVELNQVIAEVETAKALVDLPSPYAGVVASLHAEEGQTVTVGDPLVTFEIDDGTPAPQGAEPGVAGHPKPTVASNPGLGDERVPGEPGVADEPEPNLVGYGARPDRVGRPTRRPRWSAGEPAASNAGFGAATSTGARGRTVRGERPRSTPPVRALAKKLGVRIDRVEGSGADGLITREDVLAAVSCHRDVARQPRDVHGTPAAMAATPSSPGSAGAGPDARTGLEPEVVPVRGVRKHTAAAMVSSAFTAPHATVFLTVDVTRSVELLERLRTHRLARGTRITVLALAARALCLELPRHPALNSAWRDLPDGSAEIVRHRRVHLGIAVATDRGLVVPHVPDAQDLDLPDLAAALTDLTVTARDGRTTPERLTGGTISITNVGVFGVDAGTPILVPGEAAILGLGAVRRRPWEHDGEVALRDVVTLSLSFDHRVVDGEQGARFLADLGALLEDPALALLATGSTTRGAPATRGATASGRTGGLASPEPGRDVQTRVRQGGVTG
ncbi:dihydrolipoamide acetyltransferase family protein [Cellulosimicrobium cellulans]|uniref:dihydrolipoamide acetyltransferase family protein n=1 Tax=Cellulosimicrobium cellulans TaxID=1710 RepID=UPI002404D6D2|nr:dihydrolipoamide acetyltransferase family protein [Cellulosimicrobium cellulans]